MSIILYFLQSIPEGVGVIAISLALARVPLRWGRILPGGFIVAIISYIIRALPVTFGLHLPVIIFLLFLVIIRITNVTPSRTIIAVFTGFFILALLEYLVSGTFFIYTGMDPQQALLDETVWTALGVTQAVLLNIIALIVPRFLKPIEDAWKW